MPITAKLPSGSFRCGKDCAPCPYISDGLSSYTFFSTGETHPIKSNLTTCHTKSTLVIYMTHCNRCKLQYKGETKRGENMDTKQSFKQN